jgi:hypothetical protein
VPADRLYNSRRGGWSRAAVFGCYPTAVAALGLLPRARRRTLALAAASLCASVALPGMVDDASLDARRRNAVPLAGVALALLAGERPIVDRPPRPRSHAFLGAALTLMAAPWILAELGLQTSGMRQPSPAEHGVDRVHLGHHEGLDGVLLAVDGLLLEPAATSRAHRLWLALTVTYGTAVAAQDTWHEQVVKRGWAGRRLPDVVRPKPTAAWLALVAATPAVERVIRSRGPMPAPLSSPPRRRSARSRPGRRWCR